MRFAFYISGRSTRLTNFLSQAKSEIVDSIILVVSDSRITEEQKKLFQKFKISYVEFDYANLHNMSMAEKNIIFSDFLLHNLCEHEIDYVFSFGSHILAGKVLEKYKYRLINFHPAILPMFPGLKAIDQAVRHGNVFLVGNTAHFIDAGVDTGPVIMQSVTPLRHFYDSNNNYNTILDLQVTMLNKLIDIIRDNRLVVNENKVSIRNADYSVSHVYPEV